MPGQDQEEVPVLILIDPVWPTQPWFAVLLSTLFQRPVLIPRQSPLLTNESHSLIQQLSLAAWSMSGVPPMIKGFQDNPCLPGQKLPKRHTPAAGNTGNGGVSFMRKTLLLVHL